MAKNKIFNSNKFPYSILVVLGLLLIFIIGYAFWKDSNKSINQSLAKGIEPNDFAKLKQQLDKKKSELKKYQDDYERIEIIRKRYFFWTRCLLVTFVLSLFYFLQYGMEIELFQKDNVFDNLRNYLSSIVILFTTIAFVAKGNLKSFKESIEEMAISWFFKSEVELKAKINQIRIEITSIENHILILESK